MAKKTTINENMSWKELTPGGTIYTAGNAAEFNTGDWRVNKPIYKEDKCIQCLLCAPVCPDTSIIVKDSKMTGFDYDHCKGCGICAEVCPVGAIEMIAEGQED